MDTSNLYIKMCEEAVELQEYFFNNYWENLPSFVFDKGMKRNAIVFWTPKTLMYHLGITQSHLAVSIEMNKDKNYFAEESNEPYSPTAIWLPRQDQLQQFLNSAPTGIAIGIWLEKFRNFFMNDKTLEIFWDYTTDHNKPFTWEQIWLHFVMKEKFFKQWDVKETLWRWWRA